MSVIVSNYPSANQQTVNNSNAWSGLANLYANDGNYATVTLANGATSDRIRVTGFGFNLPTDAIVIGMRTRVDCKVAGGNTVTLKTYAYDATNGTSTASVDNTVNQTTDAIEYQGNPTFIAWDGNAPSITDANASTFGMEFEFVNNSGVSETISVDYIIIDLYYFIPPKIEAMSTSTPTAGTSHVMTAPSGMTTGETALLLVATDDATNTGGRQRISISSGGTGWEKIFEHGNSGTACRIAGFVKRRTDGTEGSVTISSTNSCSAIGHYMRISNCWTNIPIEFIGESEMLYAAVGTTITPGAPAFTGTNDAGLAIGFCAMDSAPGPFSVSGTDWSEYTEANNSTALGTCVAERINDGGTTGIDPTFTSTTSETGIGIVLHMHGKDAQTYVDDYVYPQHLEKAKITIDSSQVSETLTDFPLLITEKNFLAANNNGVDIKCLDTNATYEFYDAYARDVYFSSDPEGQNVLPHEVVECAKNAIESSRQFQCWVLVPSVSHTADTEIYMWWRTSITYDYGSWNAAQVWKDYIFVSHLGGRVDTAPRVARDSSQYQRTFAQTGTVNAAENAFGHGVGAANYGGTDDYIRQDPHETGFDFDTGPWHMQAWAKPDTSPVSEFISCVQNPDANYGGSASGFALCVTSDGYWGLAAGTTSPWTFNRKNTGQAASTSRWDLIAVRYNDTGSAVILNGSAASTSHTQSWAVSTLNDAFTFAANSFASGPTFDFDGSAHEIRLREGSMSDAWFAAEWANQKWAAGLQDTDDNPFITITQVTPGGSWKQEGFRWRNDDGSEAAATWMDSQDTNVTGPRNVNKRIRFLLDNMAPNCNPNTMKFKLQYRRVGDPHWKDMD